MCPEDVSPGCSRLDAMLKQCSCFYFSQFRICLFVLKAQIDSKDSAHVDNCKDWFVKTWPLDGQSKKSIVQRRFRSHECQRYRIYSWLYEASSLSEVLKVKMVASCLDTVMYKVTAGVHVYGSLCCPFRIYDRCCYMAMYVFVS